MSVLVVGLGNALLRDDGVGFRVVERVRERLGHREDLRFAEDNQGGLRLMERMVGYRRAVVVDAMTTGAAPGTVRWLRLSEVPTVHSGSDHDMSLGLALAMGRQAGAVVPDEDDVILVGIEAEDLLDFGERCTPAVEAAIPGVVDTLVAALDATIPWPHTGLQEQA